MTFRGRQCNVYGSGFCRARAVPPSKDGVESAGLAGHRTIPQSEAASFVVNGEFSRTHRVFVVASILLRASRRHTCSTYMDSVTSERVSYPSIKGGCVYESGESFPCIPALR